MPPRPGTDGAPALSDADSHGDDGSAPARLRVIVVDDDPLARRVIRDALQEAGHAVAGEAATGNDGVALALHYRPEIVLMDLGLPDVDGLEATRAILDEAPEVRVVVFTIATDGESALAALRAGASGFLTKDIDIERLSAALAGVMRGEVALSRRFTSTVVDELRRTPSGGIGLRPVRSPLTTREWEVLDLLATASTTETIAAELVLSVETVRTHIKHILRKLDVGSRAEAIERARELRAI